MTITYRDDLGIVAEKVDEFGVSFCEGKAYFNDKTVDISKLVIIAEIGILKGKEEEK